MSNEDSKMESPAPAASDSQAAQPPTSAPSSSTRGSWASRRGSMPAIRQEDLPKPAPRPSSRPEAAPISSRPSYRFRGDLLPVGGVDRWYVRSDQASVGPVGLSLLERGLAAGRVPLTCLVRHESWRVWRPLSELTERLTATPASASPPPPSVRPAPPRIPIPAQTLPSAKPIEADRARAADAKPSAGNVVPTPADVSLTSSPLPAVALPAVPLPSFTLPGGWHPAEAVEHELDDWDDPTNPRVGKPAEVGADGDAEESTGAQAPSATAEAAGGDSPAAQALPADDASVEDASVEDASADDASVEDAPAEAIEPAIAPDADAELEGPAPQATEGATDIQDALLLALSAIIQRTKSEAGLVYRVHDDGGIVVCAHGPEMLNVLGKRGPLLDPDLVAAAGDCTVIAEPAPGPAGEAIGKRIRELGVDPTGAFLIPIRPYGRLFAVVEVGRPSTYRAREVADAEDIIDAVVAEIERQGWAKG